MYKVCWPYIFWLEATSMGTCISLTKVTTKVWNMDPMPVYGHILQ